MQAIRVLERPFELLQYAFMLEDDVGIEELAELDLTEELAELRVVDRQCLRAALGGGRVFVVDEVADEREEQRGREGRVDRCIDRRDADLARFDRPQEIDEARAEAKFRDGVLELKLPKKAAAARKQVTIQ